MQFTNIKIQLAMLVEICLTSTLIPVLISVMTCTLLNVARLLLVFTTECNLRTLQLSLVSQ